ncbi:MAG: RNA polymerase sigma factor, partial [Bacteroidaceae bacterium]|nr:RNA polymerase sigma factor [Bacteroidaceae bacterium]
SYLTAVCARYITQEEELKDVLQDSFIRIFSAIDMFEYRGEGSLRAWSRRVVVNEALNALRQSKQLSPISYTEQLPDIQEEEPETDDVPPDVIQRFIRELPVGYRTVFNLYVFEDKSHQEIAQMLHIKESSSASQLSRAKSILAKRINEYKLHNNDKQ